MLSGHFLVTSQVSLAPIMMFHGSLNNKRQASVFRDSLADRTDLKGGKLLLAQNSVASL